MFKVELKESELIDHALTVTKKNKGINFPNVQFLVTFYLITYNDICP